MINLVKCFIDGNALCIVNDDFINLQESSAVFIDLNEKEIKLISDFIKKKECDE